MTENLPGRRLFLPSARLLLQKSQARTKSLKSDSFKVKAGAEGKRREKVKLCRCKDTHKCISLLSVV